MEQIEIFIAGDLVPSFRTIELFKNQKSILLFGDLLPIIEKSDWSIVNLECPVKHETETPILKSGPTLRTSIETLILLKKVGFKMLTLANNHFYDHGQAGVIETINGCKSNLLEYVGGGTSLEEANATKYVVIKGRKFAFVNLCENEFSIATNMHGGSHALNPVLNYYKIKNAKENADVVVVIVHGGHEGYQYPTLRMKQTYRFFIDAGADCVINHHQHCYSGFEKYNNKLIFYGLGNFCFDWKGKRDSIWNEGYAVKLIFTKNEIQYKLYPYEQCNNYPGVQLKNDTNAFKYGKNIDEINNVIHNDELISSEFHRLAESHKQLNNSLFEPYQTTIFRKLFNHGLLPSFFNNSQKINLINKFRCESHRDIFIDNLKTE